MKWADFEQAAPELAQLGEERFEASGLLLLGTLRRDGFPRISPVEPLIHDGQLYLGMMWQSRKALDLLRDPRCLVHSIVSNKDGSEGEFKAYGRAIDISNLATRSRYADAMFEKIGFRPEEPEYHLFAIDIESVAFVQIQEGKQVVKTWQA